MSTADTEIAVAYPLKDSDFSLLQLLNPDILANPYPLYRSMREYEPVHWDPYTHCWIVTSYSEVIFVLSNFLAQRTPTSETLIQRGLSVMEPFARTLTKQMLFMDGAAHARLRSLCASAFSPRRIAALRASVESIVSELIDRVVGNGFMDVIADLANSFPAMVTAALIGFPMEDHARLKVWSIDFAELLGNFQHNPDRVKEVLRSLSEMNAYIYEKLEEQRTSPRDGLLHALMVAEVDGGRLTDEEIVANTIVTMTGGQETTTNLIGNGLLALLRNPQALARMRSEPAILDSAIEELLRYEPPIQHTARIAPADLQLSGKAIKKGAAVIAVMAAANRDPARFPDPDRLDLTRPDNRHLSFGWAAHFCFGAPLARMEAQIAFRMLLDRLNDIQLATNSLKWRGNTDLRGLTALPISFTACH
jgi:pimeloyl-[acyl-carrier protein] synthase